MNLKRKEKSRNIPKLPIKFWFLMNYDQLSISYFQAEIFLPGGRTFYNEAMMSSQGIPQVVACCI